MDARNGAGDPRAFFVLQLPTMSTGFVELHCHSTASDGTLSPTQVVELAKRSGLTALSLTGFVDRQVQGPFQFWELHHTFVSLGAQATLVLDEIRAVQRRHVLWAAVGLGMWLNLPILFAFRAWKTRRLLESAR